MPTGFVVAPETQTHIWLVRLYNIICHFSVDVQRHHLGFNITWTISWEHCLFMAFDAQPVKDRFVILSDTESLIVGFGL